MLKNIESKTPFKFAYSKDLITKVTYSITLNLNNKSVYDVLLVIARQTNLSFRQINKVISVKKASNNYTSRVSKNERITIKGSVYDKNENIILPGANIFIENSNIGAATNSDGHFTIKLPSSYEAGQIINIIASYVGYKKQVKAITLTKNVSLVNFELDEDVFENETVVVTGISSKTSLSIAEVSVGRVSVEVLTDRQNYQGISQLFTGKISGINVLFGSGNVGSGWRFYVRSGGGLNGNGQPLIFVDGIRIDNADFRGYGTGGSSTSILANLNVDNIEDIEFLKGPAAAAEYGTNASNGVVIIKTKAGKITNGLGKSYSVDYKFNFGVNTQRLIYDESLFTQANILNNVLSKPGYIREHTLSISGGSERLKYFTSIQNRFEAGLIPDQNYLDRVTFMLNIRAYPTKNLSVLLNSTYAQSNIRRPQNDNSIYGWIFNTLVYNPPFSKLDSISISSIKNTVQLDQFLGSGRIIWKPSSNFEFNSSIGLDFNTIINERLYPFGFGIPKYQNGDRAIYRRTNYNLSANFNVKYSNKLSRSIKFSFALGSQLFEDSGYWLQNRVRGFSHQQILTIDAAEALISKADNKWNSRQAGIYFSNQYSIDNKIFFTLAGRKDYSSSLGFKTPSIFYPRASIAIRLDKFNIIPKSIKMFKIRTAYGESGQLPGKDDGIPVTWSAFAGANGVGATIGSIGNGEIEPERISEFELGFDAEYLKLFSLEFTYYIQNVTNSIVQTSFPPSIGFGNAAYPYNVGAVKGWGTETFLQLNPFKTKNSKLTLNFIWNYQYNEVVSLGPETMHIFPGSQDMNVLKPGFRKYEFFDEITEGATFNPDGTFKGYIRGNKKIDLGSPIPDHSGSISLDFKFFNDFDLYISTEWGLNNKVWSYTIRRMMTTNTYIPVNRIKAQLGLLNIEGVQKLTPGSPEYIDKANEYAKWYNADYGNFVFDADYFIIRDISLGYDLTTFLKDNFPLDYITDISIGAAVRNVAKFSKYPLDHEVNYSGGRGGNFSNDFATLPAPRTWNFWIRILF